MEDYLGCELDHGQSGTVCCAGPGQLELLPRQLGAKKVESKKDLTKLLIYYMCSWLNVLSLKSVLFLRK